MDDLDEKLTEEEALAQAKEEGIEFTDYWTVEGEVNEMGIETRFDTEEAARGVAGDEKAITQHRERKE